MSGMAEQRANFAKAVAAALLVALAPVSGMRESAAPASPEPPELRVEIRGGSDVETARTRRALERVLATRVGRRARALLESGALPQPLVIALNARGDNLTPYRVPARELSE